MQIYHRFNSQFQSNPTALTIGNFDGLHLGHRALLQSLVAQAKQQNLSPTVITFEPHPKEFFLGDAAPARVQSLRDKLQGFKALGIQQVWLAPFTELCAMNAEVFIEELLLKHWQVRLLFVGRDFHFGRGRSGNFAMLQQAAVQHFELKAIDDQVFAQTRISSTRVREALAAGALSLAEQMLGRPYQVSGHVTHGQKIGRQMSFPTLNLRLPKMRGVLRGIFVVTIQGLANTLLHGVASIGSRPSVTLSNQVWLEVYALDWEGDAYGKLIKVTLLSRLRDEKKFATLTALQTAIAQDVAAAKAYFKEHPT